MNLRFSTVSAIALAAAAATTTAAPAVFASSHREAPAITEDPTADNTDLYAWVEGDKLVVLANYIPLEEPAGGPNFHKFSDDVLYEIHMARGADSLEDALTYQVRFTTAPYVRNEPGDLKPTPAGGNEFFSQIAGGAQTYSITKVENGASTVLVANVPVAPANIGPRTNAIAYGITTGTYEDFATSGTFLKTAGDGTRVFAGPRDDGFSVDLGAVFDLAGLESVLGGQPFDNVSGYNVHTIALEIPLTVANGGAPVTAGKSDAQTLGVWASASRKKVRVLRADGGGDTFGPWVQVSRLGLPLVNEAVIGLQDKDKYNRTHPKDNLTNFGGYFLNPMLVRDAEFAGFYMAGGPLAGVDPAKMRTGRLDIVQVISLTAFGYGIKTIGDVLRVDLGTASSFPNGRKVNKGTNTEEDVTAIELSLILTGNPFAGVDDGVTTNDATFKTTFPYLATPWEGSRQGKGEPQP